MYNIHDPDDITYVKKSICSFLFERARPSIRALQNRKSSWCFRGIWYPDAEVEPLSKWPFTLVRLMNCHENTWSKGPPLWNPAKYRKVLILHVVYASGTGDSLISTFLHVSSRKQNSCFWLWTGIPQSEHQWTFLVALGAIETPTISCTYCIQNYQVYTWYRCVIHVDAEPPNPQKTPWDSSIMISICKLTWHVKLRPLLKKKTPTRNLSTEDSTRQLFYMSTVMPFFLIFSTIGYVPLGVLSWTRRVWWGELKCCQICYRSWDCCNFVHIFSVFFSLMMMLRGWYLLHEKLLTERSLVTFWLNKQLQNVIGLVTWLTSFQSLVWLQPRSHYERPIHQLENIAGFIFNWMEAWKKIVEFEWKHGHFMDDGDWWFLPRHVWDGNDPFLTNEVSTGWFQPPSCTWSTGFHRFWGHKSSELKPAGRPLPRSSYLVW